MSFLRLSGGKKCRLLKTYIVVNNRVLPAVPIYLRSLRSTFQLSSFFATMEEEIPPWKERRRNSTVTRSNEIDRWKIRIEEEMDGINVHTRTCLFNVDMI